MTLVVIHATGKQVVKQKKNVLKLMQDTNLTLLLRRLRCVLLARVQLGLMDITKPLVLRAPLEKIVELAHRKINVQLVLPVMFLKPMMLLFVKLLQVFNMFHVC